MQFVRSEALVVHVDVAVDGDVAWGCAQAGYLSVITHLEVERSGCGAVGAGLEQKRVTLRAELIAYLLVRDGINGRLNLARRHAGDQRCRRLGQVARQPRLRFERLLRRLEQ